MMFKRLKMQKVCLMLLPVLLILTSCFAGNITTDYPRNHVFGAGDQIRFLDENNNRELLGTLTVLSMQVLSEEEFVHRSWAGRDEEGHAVYEDVVYRQVVQINFVYSMYVRGTIGRRVRPSQFMHVYDTAGARGIHDPNASFTTVPVENAQSIVVGLRNPSDTIRIDVMISGTLSPNAIVSLSLEDVGAPSLQPEPVEPPAVPEPVEPPDTELGELQAQLDVAREEAAEQQVIIDELRAQLDELRQNGHGGGAETGSPEENALIRVLGFAALGMAGCAVVFLVLWLVGLKKNRAEDR